MFQFSCKSLVFDYREVSSSIILVCPWRYKNNYFIPPWSVQDWHYSTSVKKNCGRCRFPCFLLLPCTYLCSWSNYHEIKKSHWLINIFPMFSARNDQKKLNLVQLSPERNRTENFPITWCKHYKYACSETFLFRSVPVRGKFSVSGKPPLDSLTDWYVNYL